MGPHRPQRARDGRARWRRAKFTATRGRLDDPRPNASDIEPASPEPGESSEAEVVSTLTAAGDVIEVEKKQKRDPWDRASRPKAVVVSDSEGRMMGRQG